jgi:hypothetical protein
VGFKTFRFASGRKSLPSPTTPQAIRESFALTAIGDDETGALLARYSEYVRFATCHARPRSTINS